MSRGIQIVNVVKTFENGFRALDGIELDICAGEFMVLVGPSGCGKSTLLRVIAGLEAADYGLVSIAGRDVTDLPPRDRDIAMVFQNYALYPHMTVEKNLVFGLRMRRTAKVEIEESLSEAAGILGLDELLTRKPAALSGGQRQRVAMGRAMVRHPAAFLMDEPLSNLDAKLRVSMRAELAQLHDRLGVTTVYVTHDQTEAITLGDRVAVMRDGVIQQCSTPKDLFDRPANLFVAQFIGSPAMNFAAVTIENGIAHCRDFAVPMRGYRSSTQPVILGVRPSDLSPVDSSYDGPTITLVPEVVEELGSERIVLSRLSAPAVDVENCGTSRSALDDGVLLMDDRRTVWSMRVTGRTPVEVGQPLVAAVDVAHAHVFDASTGERVAPHGVEVS